MDRVVAVDPGTGLPLTEAQLDAWTVAAVLRLRKRGVREGDAVLICLPTGTDLLVAVNAVIALGAVAMPLAYPPSPEAVHGVAARVMISDRPELAEESRVRVVVSPHELAG
ncbi:AMP-binding protein [Nonomuraea soli]|uniref:Acyl-coenzyme A synthetase/AMP-(Fatty) acid ligase n=1 Tax=Nonomuraea soli TaxID=1032476 RepID=A0A7W0CMM2_9ACTN|nr:AMP-binding protein [Nonomuraea soli]MBA2893952.1 acyl-coenzyme A synthetase/AMP-(fatty) acid ligase [Nonomuraea soli]